MAVDKSKYVVLDIETNGLYVSDDILSISIYKPDDGTSFNKYLPLELSRHLNPSASAVNGITYEDLLDATPLTQQDVNNLIEQFELDKRIILTYSGFDKRMLRHYFNRKGLYGFERFNFFNFKQDIISSKYSEGNVKKDYLCAMYGIGGIQKIHSSVNDCVLEWQLYEKMDGKKLFITNNNVFEMNDDYIIPISYFSSHPNLEKHVPNFPYIKIETTLVKRFELAGKGINRFETNINGKLIEHLINALLNVEVEDSLPFLLENKSKLHFLGTLPSNVYDIPLYFKEDGTVQEVNPQDKAKTKEFNQSILSLKPQLTPVIEFIAQEIFRGERIKSQELVINRQDNILALCDLSTKHAVLEIKTNFKTDAFAYRNQLFYEANGRKCFLLQVDWSHLPDVFAIEILEAHLSLGERPQKTRRISSIETVQARINNKNIDVIQYTGQKAKVTLKCKICEHEWQVTYRIATNNPKCPFCEPKTVQKQKEKTSDAERKNIRAANYAIKLLQKSNGSIYAKNYIGAKDNVTAECLKCGHKWNIRADHLLDRLHCPNCKANKTM